MRGAASTKTLQFVASLGNVLDAMDRDEEAEEQLRKALDGQRAALGASHEAAISTQGTLALLLRKRKKEEEAEALFRDALDKSRRVARVAPNPTPRVSSHSHSHPAVTFVARRLAPR